MECINDIIKAIEEFAPKSYQESYDNSGLIVGDPSKKISKALITLDCTEEVIDEAINLKCGLIIAHHPIVFSGLKSFTGKNYIERVIIKAIKNDIAIYAAHTNLDNMQMGVNQKIAEKLNLVDCQILAPISGKLEKLYTYIPKTHVEKVRKVLHEAGAGNIGNYSDCSFSTTGEGKFKANADANPFVGLKNKIHTETEIKLEVIFEAHLELKLISALKASHPYEEIAFEIITLDNKNPEIGAGMIGKLSKPLEEEAFLKLLKKKMQTKCIRHTELLSKKIQRVAFCGGAGSFLLNDAIAQKADVFITGDFKYHQFFDAEKKLIIADIGHYESEQFTNEIFYDVLSKKFPKFAILNTKVNTNPVHYY